MRSAIELSEGGGGNVSRRPTGAVEFYHALCLRQRGKPLRPPLGLIVGGLVADFDSHGGLFELREFYRVSGGVSPPAVTVDPLSHADGRHDGSGQDGTAGDPSEAVFSRSAGEGHANRPRDRIGSYLTGSGAMLAVQSEHGCVV